MFGFLWWLIPTCPNRCSTKSPSSAPHGSQFPRSAPGSHALSIKNMPFPQPRHQGVQRHLHMNRGQHDLHIHLPKMDSAVGLAQFFSTLLRRQKRVCVVCAKAAEGWLIGIQGAPVIVANPTTMSITLRPRLATYRSAMDHQASHCLLRTASHFMVAHRFPRQAAQTGCSGSSIPFRGCRCSNLDAARSASAVIL